MQRVDERLISEMVGREPRSTTALAELFSARRPRDVGVARAGRSYCVIVRREPLVWLGYPQLVDKRDAPDLAAAIERTAVVGLDGPPQDVDPLIAHMTRAGETEQFRTMIVPAEDCYLAPSGPETRMATPLDMDALEVLFSDYEVRFASGRRSLRRQLERSVRNHAVVVHDALGGNDDIAGAAIAGGLTPQFLVGEHMRVSPGSRGQGISWALASRLVEMAQAYGMGLLFSLSPDNPMTMPEGQGHMELHTSVNLRLPERVPGERRVRRLTLKVSRKLGG